MSWLPDWATGYDAANAEKAAAADAQLRQMNAVDYSPGGSIYNDAAGQYGSTYADSLAGTVAADYRAQDISAPMGQDAQRGQIQDAFDTTLQKKADGIFGTFFGGLFDVIKTILKAIPFWVWIVAAVALFLYFGGAGWLRGKAKKHFA